MFAAFLGVGAGGVLHISEGYAGSKLSVRPWVTKEGAKKEGTAPACQGAWAVTGTGMETGLLQAQWRKQPNAAGLHRSRKLNCPACAGSKLSLTSAVPGPT